MYGGNDNIRCLDIELFKITRPLEVECFSVTGNAEFSAYALTEPLGFSCFKICAVNKEGLYWMWDAGEVLLWDNNMEIDL